MRARPEAYDALVARRSSDDGAGRWHTLHAEDSEILIDLSQVVYIRRERGRPARRLLAGLRAPDRRACLRGCCGPGATRPRSSARSWPSPGAGEHGVLWQLVSAWARRSDATGARRSTCGPCGWSCIAYLANIAHEVRGAPPPARGSRSCRRCPPPCRGLSYPSAHSTTSFAAAAVLRGVLPAAPAVRDRDRHGRVAPLRSACTTPPTCVAGAAAGHRAGGADPVKVGHRRAAQRGQVLAVQRAHPRRRRRRPTTPSPRWSPTWPWCPCPTTRLDAVVDTIGPRPTVYETIEFHDIAGPGARRPRGRGAGQQVPGQHPRDRRARARGARPRRRPGGAPRGPRRPGGRRGDDRDRAALRRPRAGRAPAGARWRARPSRGDKAKVAEEAWLRELVAALGEGRPARSVPVPEAAPRRAAQPLAADLQARALRGQRGRGRRAGACPPALAAHAAARRRAAAAAVSRPDRGGAVRARRRGGAGRCARTSAAGESGLATVVREAWELLGLITFFTAGEGKEGRAWAIPRGTARPAGRRADPHRHRARLRGRRGGVLAGPGGRRAATRRRASGPSCASRAATTRCATAT